MTEPDDDTRRDDSFPGFDFSSPAPDARFPAAAFLADGLSSTSSSSSSSTTFRFPVAFLPPFGCLLFGSGDGTAAAVAFRFKDMMMTSDNVKLEWIFVCSRSCNSRS